MNAQRSSEIINEFIQGRRDLIVHIVQIADKLDQHHRNVKITKVVTSSTGIFGGLIALGGVLLAAPTGGFSLAAVFGGSILGSASTIAHVGSDIAEGLLTRANLNDLNMICKTDEANVLSLNRYLNHRIETLQNENSSESANPSATSAIAAQLTTINVACSIVRITQRATLTVRTVRIIGRASIFLNLISLPLEIIHLTVDARKLHRNQPCKVSVQLRSLANNLSEQMLNLQEYRQVLLENQNQTEPIFNRPNSIFDTSFLKYFPIICLLAWILINFVTIRFVLFGLAILAAVVFSISIESFFSSRHQ